MINNTQVTALKPPLAEIAALKGMMEELGTQVAAVKESVAQSSKPNDIDELEIHKLRRQVAELQAQSAIRKTPQVFSTQRSIDTVRNRELGRNSLRSDRSRAWYCFRCREDGHLAINCKNAANPDKVTEKKMKLREQQSHRDSQYRRSAQSLN